MIMKWILINILLIAADKYHYKYLAKNVIGSKKKENQDLIKELMKKVRLTFT